MSVLAFHHSHKLSLYSQKSAPNDLVTETDQEVEKMLINGLDDKFPCSKFIGEESVAAGSGCVLTEEPTWIIDPIDGTTNFVSSNPNMCTILGYMVNKVTLTPPQKYLDLFCV